MISCSTRSRTAASRRWLDALRPRAHHVRPAGERARDRSGPGGTAPDAAVARRRPLRRRRARLRAHRRARRARRGGLRVRPDRRLQHGRVHRARWARSAGRRTRSRRRCRDELVRRSPFNDYTLPRVSLIRSRKATAMLERVFGDAADRGEPADPLHGQRRPPDEPSSSSIGAGRSPTPSARACRSRGSRRRSGTQARLLVDGGVLNNLPVDHMAERGRGPDRRSRRDPPHGGVRAR